MLHLFEGDASMASFLVGVDGLSITLARVTPIKFDRIEFDRGNNYNQATGKYTVPINGTYLVLAQFHAINKEAELNILVNGQSELFFRDVDSTDSDGVVMCSAVIFLQLKVGDEMWVEPWKQLIVHGWSSADRLNTWFGATLLYTRTCSINGQWGLMGINGD